MIKEINKHIHLTAKREIMKPVMSPDEIMIVTSSVQAKALALSPMI